MSYDILTVTHQLRQRGVTFKSFMSDGKPVREADASRLDVVGIDTLGKLDFLMNHQGYTVFLPEIRQTFQYKPFVDRRQFDWRAFSAAR